jgi:serine/threonine protein kinase/tetratricopeptide (TPR) repeat protein
MQEQSIFIEALEKNDPRERAEFLERACAGAPDIRQRIEKLLERHLEDDSFLESHQVSLSATVDRSIAERPGDVIGPYKLLEQIGEGGFGVVFMAEQQQPVRRKVALKVLKPGMDTRQVVARFEAERQALALMDHPNIAHVFDGGTTETGRPYFVMELVRGVPITEFCDQSCLAIHQRLELFVDVCQAVQHAHQKGIIHRDIKPNNVLVTLHDGKPVVKVIDFGIAKAMGQQLTEKTLFTNFAQMIGTPLYMSPEQAEMSGLDVDTRSDVYSLGVLLYELLTGTTPFESERLSKVGHDEMRRIIREEEPPKPSTRMSTVGKLATTASQKRQGDPRKLSKLFRGELDWIVMKALEKERSRRYETASGLAADVKRYLNDEQVAACPPSAAYRFRKFARRNRRVLATTAIVGMVMLVAVSAVAWTIGWANRDRAVRQAAADQKAEIILSEAESWQEQRKWPEALTAVKRAEGMLASDGSEPLRRRIDELRRDVEMMLRLDDARFQGLDGPTNGKDFNFEVMESAYREAFHADGIDLETLQAEEAAELVRARSIRDELVGALDAWASYTRSAEVKDKALGVARAVDSDEWRNRVRDAIWAGKSGQAELAELAKSPRICELPTLTLSPFAKVLVAAELIDDAIAVLREAQQRYPDDFWINIDLAYALGRKESPPRHDEEIRFYATALGLRPRCLCALSNIGVALMNKGEPAQAVAYLRRAVEINPRYAQGQYNLAEALADMGRCDEAIACFSKACELEPNYSVGHMRIARGCARTKKWSDAAAAFDRALESDDKDFDGWMLAAAVRAVMGDVPGYTRICHGMLGRFGDTDNPQGAERTAKACLLMPNGLDAADFDMVQKLADRAVTGNEQHGYYGFFAMAKGLADYRAGRCEGAIKWIELSGLNPNGIHWDAIKFAVVAMAHDGLGRSEQAKAALASAQACMEKMPDPAKGQLFGTDNWHDWLHAQILYREAEALLKKPARETGP